MAKYTMEAIFKAIDRISGPMTRIRTGATATMRRFNALSGSMVRLSSSMRNIFPPFTSLFSTALLYAGARKLATLTKSLAEYGDNIAKAADRTGIGIEKFQEFQYIADLSGISAEEFGKSLEIMNKNLGQLRIGTGTIKGLKLPPEFMKQLNSAKSNEEAFDLMIKAIRNTGDASRKATLATAFFGKSGQKLINMANTSEEAFEEMRKEIARYGIMSESAARESEVFLDELTKLSKAGRGVGFALVEKLLPVLTPLITKLTDWVAANREIIATKLGKFIENLATRIADIDFDRVLAGIVNFVAKAGMFIDRIGGIGNALLILIGILNLPLIAAIFAVGSALVKLGIVLAANPIILVITLIIAAVAALAYAVYKNWEPIKAFVKKLWGGIVKIFTNAFNTIFNAIAAFGAAWWKFIKALFSASPLKLIFGGWDGVKTYFKNLWDAVGGIFSAGWNLIKVIFSYSPLGLLVRSWGPITDFFISHLDTIKSIFSAAWEFIKTLFSYSPLGLIIENWSGITDFFSGLWDSVKSSAVNTFNDLVDWIWTASGIKGVLAAIEKVKSWFSDDEAGEGEVPAPAPSPSSASPLITPHRKGEAEVVVRFDNMPRGAQATPAGASGGIDLGLETSYALPAGVR
jgi:phage-related minor tail protein